MANTEQRQGQDRPKLKLTVEQANMLFGDKDLDYEVVKKRDWYKKPAALVSAGVIMGGLMFGGVNALGNQKSAENPNPGTTLVSTPTTGEAAGSASPESTTTTTEAGVNVGDVVLAGFPDKVDPKNVDKADHDVFKNTIGLGSEMVLGEPGGLLVGPDFDSTNNPYGDNPGGWQTMYDSGGSIRPFSPVSQEVMHSESPFYQNLPEGGFDFFSLGQGTFEIGASDENGEFQSNGLRINLPPIEGNNYFLIIRGRYPDGEQDSDLNLTTRVTDYVPGHALAMMYESRDRSNLAFISEGQFVQMAQTSHSSGTNLGAEGASRLTVVMVDVNTRAYAVMQQTQGRFEDSSRGWQAIGSNWR